MVRVLIVGGGAAGLCAAWWAARAGAEVLVVDGAKEPGRKILISGGGRCNVLPCASALDDFHTQGSRNVLKRLFRTWPLEGVRAWFEEDLDLPLVAEEDTGKLFPVADKARVVRDRLVEAVEGFGAEVRWPWRVAEIHPPAAGADGAPAGRFRVVSDAGEVEEADRVILATGGQSVPQTGSDGHGYRLAKQLGHTLLHTYPALVPLTSDQQALTELSGLSVLVRWSARKNGKVLEERERALLFTHQGFSGPAVLDASHWVVREGAEVFVAWEAGTEEEWIAHLNARARRGVEKALAEFLPNRLAATLVQLAGLRGDLRCGNLDRAKRDRLLRLLTEFPLPVNGNRGFQVAEVTGGGVPLGEVNPSTLESRGTADLYLCGEILDTIGRLGGFNFLWAWVTGRLAGESAARAPVDQA